MERRLAAILAADVAGYSALVGRDEEGTLRALAAISRSRIGEARRCLAAALERQPDYAKAIECCQKAFAWSVCPSEDPE